MKGDEEFIRRVRSCLRPGVILRLARSAETICGPVALGLVADTGERRIAFQYGALDEWAQALVLGAGAVDAIYEVEERSFREHPDDCLFVLSRSEPGIFSDEARQRLPALASDEARQPARDPDFLIGFTYGSRLRPDGHPDFLHIERRWRPTGRPGEGRLFWWDTIWQFASASAMTEGRCTVEEMKARWDRSIEERDRRIRQDPSRRFRGDEP